MRLRLEELADEELEILGEHHYETMLANYKGVSAVISTDMLLDENANGGWHILVLSGSARYAKKVLLWQREVTRNYALVSYKMYNSVEEAASAYNDISDDEIIRDLDAFMESVKGYHIVKGRLFSYLFD